MKEKTTEKTMFHWLDLLRFLAAFFVVLNHSRNDFFMMYGDLPIEQQGLLSSVFYFLGRLGHESVIVFFVLSGFLVGGMGLKRLDNNTFRYRSYAIDRCVRIMLPLIGSILFWGIVCIVTGEQFDWFLAAGNLFSLQGVFCGCLVSPFWSLSFEVWFYILLFAIALIKADEDHAIKYKYIRIIGALLFVGCCFVFSRLNAVYLFLWFMGAVAYLIRPQKPNKALLFVSVFGILMFSALYEVSSATMSFSSPIVIKDTSFLEIMLSFFFCVFIQQIILLKPKNKIGVVLDRLGHNLSKFSYTLYLAHRIVFILFFTFVFEKQTGDMSASSMLTYLAFLLAVLLICYLHYCLFERQTDVVKKWLKKKIC